MLSRGRVVAQGDVASLRLASIRRLRAGLRGADPNEVTKALTATANITDVDVAAGDIVRLTATVNGPIDPLVKLLARYEVVDLSVEEPDLEESVLGLYGAEAKGDDRG